MPRGSSRIRDTKQEYADRKARAIARGFTGYGQERRVRREIASAWRAAGERPPDPRTKLGRQAWDVILSRPEPLRTREAIVRAVEREEVALRWKETMEGPVREGQEGYGEAVRFVLPGTQWAADRPLIEYRGRMQTRQEAVDYIQNIKRSAHVLVVVPVVDEYGNEYYEVWLDYVE